MQLLWRLPRRVCWPNKGPWKTDTTSSVRSCRRWSPLNSSLGTLRIDLCTGFSGSRCPHRLHATSCSNLSEPAADLCWSRCKTSLSHGRGSELWVSSEEDVYLGTSAPFLFHIWGRAFGWKNNYSANSADIQLAKKKKKESACAGRRTLPLKLMPPYEGINWQPTLVMIIVWQQHQLVQVIFLCLHFLPLENNRMSFFHVKLKNKKLSSNKRETCVWWIISGLQWSLLAITRLPLESLFVSLLNRATLIRNRSCTACCSWRICLSLPKPNSLLCSHSLMFGWFGYLLYCIMITNYIWMHCNENLSICLSVCLYFAEGAEWLQRVQTLRMSRKVN